MVPSKTALTEDVMNNGKNGHEQPRVEVLLFDAMYTIIEAKGSRKNLLARVFGDILGQKVNANHLWKLHREIRKKMPATADFRGTWDRWNVEILKSLGLPNTEATRRLGIEIHHRVLADVNLYEVRTDMCKLLEECQKLGIRMGIASNQYDYYLQQMFEKHGLSQYFSQKELIFTSDRWSTVEERVAKPSDKFYQMILRDLQLSGEKVVLVGNSLRNDAPATRSGFKVVILDRDSGRRQEAGKLSPIELSFNNTKPFLVNTPRGILSLITKWLNP